MRRWIVRAAVSAAAAVVLLTVVPLPALLQALRRMDAWTWVASLVIFFAGHFLNALKLRLLVGPSRVSVAACVQAQYAGLVANLSLPGLAGGDIVRAACLAPSAGMTRVVLASLFDRLLDTATLLVLVALALPFAGLPDALRPHLPTLGAGAVTAALGTTVLALAAAVWLLRRNRRLTDRVREGWTQVRAGRGALVAAAGISLGVQAAFVLTNVWMARRVGVDVGIAAWFIAWPLSKLIAVLPISLGGIGVREAALVSLMLPYGAPRDAVLASGILWQAVLTVSGVLGLAVTQVFKPAAPATVTVSPAPKV